MGTVTFQEYLSKSPLWQEPPVPATRRAARSAAPAVVPVAFPIPERRPVEPVVQVEPRTRQPGSVAMIWLGGRLVKVVFADTAEAARQGAAEAWTALCAESEG
jgi:hypothetical protein